MTESLIGRKVRLTGEDWGYSLTPPKGTVHTITHDPGWEPHMPESPGITFNGDTFYVVFEGQGHDDDRHTWGGDLVDLMDEFGELLDTYHDAVVERTRNEEAAFDRAFTERVQDEEAAARRALIAWAKALTVQILDEEGTGS